MDAETIPKYDSNVKSPERPTFLEINMKPNKPEPTEKMLESNKTKLSFQPTGIVSNPGEYILQTVEFLSSVGRVSRRLLLMLP